MFILSVALNLTRQKHQIPQIKPISLIKLDISVCFKLFR